MNGDPAIVSLPDRAEAERFVHALTGSVTTPMTFQTFTDPREWRAQKVDGDGRAWPKDEKGKPQDPLARIRHGTIAAHWNELVRLNRAGAGIYVMVNQGNGRGRGNENIRSGGALRALFLDDDSGELTLTALEVIEPSIAVQSRSGLQPYWCLRPGETLEHFRTAQEALAARFGTDPAVKDLARVMRVPGFFHQKDPDAPFFVRVVQAKNVAYSIAEVLDGFGITLPPAPLAPAKRSTMASGVRARKAYPTLPEARESFNRDHTPEWGPSGAGTCPVCGHNDCFGELPERPGRWHCFSSGHDGVGQRGESGWWGDALDVAAHEAGRSAEELLRDKGYLPPLKEEPPPPGDEYAPNGTSHARETCITHVLTRLSTVRAKPVRWLWPGRIAFGKLTIIDGDPGNLKSTVALDIIARLTTGRPMPREDQPTCAPARALIVSAEDDAADTIRPRLEAAGADLELVELLAVQVGNAKDLLPVLSDHMPQIAAALEESAAKFLLLDPLAALLGTKIDMWKDQDVRRVLGPLKNVIERSGAAGTGIRHLNKAHAGKGALYAGGGSIGIAGAARSVICVGRNPQEPVQRVLALVKSNSAEIHAVPSLAYHSEKTFVDGDSGEKIETIRIVWDGPSAYTADELLAAQVPESHEERNALDEAKDVVLQVLRNGPVEAKELEKQAKALNIAPRTLVRARGALGVRATWNAREGKWRVALPVRSTLGTLGTLAPPDGDSQSENAPENTSAKDVCHLALSAPSDHAESRSDEARDAVQAPLGEEMPR